MSKNGNMKVTINYLQVKQNESKYISREQSS